MERTANQEQIENLRLWLRRQIAIADIVAVVPALEGGEHFVADGPCGVGLIVYSLFTKYEWGPFGFIPMPVHLVFDIVASLFLALSPWIFGFSGEALNVWLPHVVVGVTVIIVVLFSKPQPETTPRAARA